jgi:hypothetical protein
MVPNPQPGMHLCHQVNINVTGTCEIISASLVHTRTQTLQPAAKEAHTPFGHKATLTDAHTPARKSPTQPATLFQLLCRVTRTPTNQTGSEQTKHKHMYLQQDHNMQHYGYKSSQQTGTVTKLNRGC